MDQVDFGYVGRDSLTIYSSCFQKLIRIKSRGLEAECEKLAPETEKLFYFLVEEGKKHGFDVDSILEIPRSAGSTCFSLASHLSDKISKYIIDREVNVNNITIDMNVSSFKYPDLAVPMMRKGINPHVINYDGISEIDRNPSSFESEEAKELLAQFPRSVHFSIEDISCAKTCRSDCQSKFKRFNSKNGEFVKMTDANSIGQGGFGSVFKGSFHGEDKAMKCVFNQFDQDVDQKRVPDAVSELEKNISEIRIQMSSSGTGVIVPEAWVRQQNQEKDENGKWIAENYNIFIYPLYDCNLYELHGNHYNQFNDEILRDILHQCLTRKRSVTQLQFSKLS